MPAGFPPITMLTARRNLVGRAAIGTMLALFAGSDGAAARPPTPIVEFAHLTACVGDPAATGRFLEDALGWRVLRKQADPAAARLPRGTIRVEDSRGFRLHLRRATARAPACSGAPYEALTFATTDLGAVLDRLPPGGSQRGARSIGVPAMHTAGTPVILHAVAGSQRREPTPSSKGTARVDRIAIFVSDLEKTAAFYTDVLGLARSTASIELDGAANARSGGLRVAFIDARGVWLALVQPVGPGPLMDFLQKNGDGYIAELIVEVDDLAAEYDRMRSRGVVLVDTGGMPVDPVEKAHVLVPYGDRIAYFPTESAGGLVIELAQRGPSETSLLERRDRASKLSGTPR